MTEEGPNTKPFNVRLPMWAIDYIDRRSTERGVTKTQIVVEALSGLKARELQSLMREGYEEMRDTNRQMANDTLPASLGILPE
ncbi:MAG: hypothetical protein M1274_10590 [Actinobacteria bacterium]|nr:hypothetical protein [Actinomycetota bacterium]